MKTKGQCGKGKSIAHRSVVDAFLALWHIKIAAAPHLLLGNPPDLVLADILDIDDVDITSVYTAATDSWTHTITVTYKPESPVDHIGFASAGRDLVDDVAAAVAYCGCSTTLDVTDHTSGYDIEQQVTGGTGKTKKAKSQSKKGKCKGAFTQPKSKSSKVRRSGVLGLSETPHGDEPATSETVKRGVVAAVAAVAVFAIAVAMVAARRRNRPDNHLSDALGSSPNLSSSCKGRMSEV